MDKIRTTAKQLLNQWRKNLWIGLELLLVFCLVWFMADYFFVLTYNRSIPSHRNVDHAYYISIGTLSPGNEGYDPAEDTPGAMIANFRRLVGRVKEYPGVESAALARSYSSFPGTGGFTSRVFRNPADTAVTVAAQLVTFIAEEDYFRVFRHTADDGGRAVSLADYNLSDPSAIVITRMMARRLFPGESAVGKEIEFVPHPGVETERLRIADVIDDIKRFDYLRPYCVVFRQERINADNYPYIYLGIRTDSSIPEAQFIPTFRRAMGRTLAIGNYYLRNIYSFSSIRQETNYTFGITNQIRMRTAFTLFLLINIALCVLGSFRQRVNSRREEIGIRRALGADRNEIRRQFVREGLLLLTLAALPALVIELQFVFLGTTDELWWTDLPSYGDYLTDHTVVRFLLTNLITWLLLAAMILLGISYPARRAARIKPVEALRDE